jgi:hypothetical protein
MNDLENLIGALVMILNKLGGTVTLTEEDFNTTDFAKDIAIEVNDKELTVKLVDPEPESKIITPKLEIVK